MLSTNTIIEEVESAAKILTELAARLKGGVPGIDNPGSEEATEAFIEQVASELLLVAGKTGNLSETLRP